MKIKYKSLKNRLKAKKRKEKLIQIEIESFKKHLTKLVNKYN